MIRKSLGRGLDALLESTAEPHPAPGDRRPDAPNGRDLMMIAVERIAPGPFQPRRHFDAQRLQELKLAIEAQGVIEPLVVRPRPVAGADGMPHYELIAGERRLRAAREAGLAAVPVIVRALDDRAALEMSLVENLAREDLNPIDEARALHRLNRDFSLTHEQIAERVGKSRPYVTNALRMLELAPEVLAMVEAGQLSPGQVRPLLSLDQEAQVGVAKRIAEQGITARGAEQIATAHRARHASGKRAIGADTHDPNSAALAEALQRSLARKVRITRRRGRTPGRVELDYYDHHDLTELASLLTAAAAQRRLGS